MVKGITTIIGMIPKGGRYAKSVVNFVHEIPQNWEKFKSAIKQIDDLLKIGKLKLDGKQKTIFESNKNILKNHEKVTKKVEAAPPVKKDPFLGWTPTLVERSKARNIYKELDPPKAKYTKEMEAIDEELDALAFGGDKYSKWSEAEKATLFEKLQAEMKKLIDAAQKKDIGTLSLGELNKKSHDLQRRIREIADNPNIPGTVTEGPKHDMIKALYDSENPLINAARIKAIKNKNLKKYGDKFPTLDPDNDAFIVMYLDDSGNPVKMSRFIGKFSAERHPITADLTRKEGHSWYDRWDPKKGKLREEGKEVWHETVDREGKTIMSNPEYKLPKTELLDINTELYTNLSTSDLAKKGFSLKQIDMIRKGREARKYLEKTKHKDHNIAMHEQTSTNEIGNVMEDLYTRGDDVYKMSIEEWTKKIPEYFAGGGRVPGFATGGISNLFQERQGFRTGNIAKLPEFLRFVEKLLIKASNEIRRGIGKWKGLDIKQKIVQHDNLTKLATEFQKTKKFDKSFNEYFGIDAEKAFIEAQAKVKKPKVKDEFYSKKDMEKEWAFENKLAKQAMKQEDQMIDKALSGMDERTLIKTKYPGISDDLLDKILVDANPQRKADVMSTMDQYLKLREIGKSEAEAYEIITRSFSKTPTKHATGGLIPGYATGGVSNLFRSR